MEDTAIEVGEAASLQTLCFRSRKRTLELFLGLRDFNQIPQDARSLKLRLTTKINDEYGPVKDLPPPSLNPSKVVSKTNGTSFRQVESRNNQKEENIDVVVNKPSYPSRPGVTITDDTEEEEESSYQQVIQSIPKAKQENVAHSIIAYQNSAGIPERIRPPSNALALKNPYEAMKPDWHPPWKLSRVIAGHLGWVRCVAVDPSNEWFATGAGDRTIKIWDLASGQLKVTLTGHINTVRGLAISNRHPYLFSAAEDKQVKCWDLEQNKVIRHYHGHLSGVYCLSLHPTLDVLITGGRDSVARVWDMRTKACVHVLSGHHHTVGSIITQSTEPQVITGSHDSTIRLWDLAKGTALATLTHHKKSVRALAAHPVEYTMASASPDNIKKWKFPEGNFMTNFSGHTSIVNALALNRDNVLVSGADNGSLYFWDYKTGYTFQKLQTVAQSGSLESEAGIFAMAFDQTGTRLITCEADKSIKIYKEDETATPETHPIEDWKPTINKW